MDNRTFAAKQEDELRHRTHREQVECEAASDIDRYLGARTESESENIVAAIRDGKIRHVRIDY